MFAHMAGLWCVTDAHMAGLWCVMDAHMAGLWCVMDAHMAGLWCVMDAHMAGLWCVKVIEVLPGGSVGEWAGRTLRSDDRSHDAHLAFLFSFSFPCSFSSRIITHVFSL